MKREYIKTISDEYKSVFKWAYENGFKETMLENKIVFESKQLNCRLFSYNTDVNNYKVVFAQEIIKRFLK